MQSDEVPPNEFLECAEQLVDTLCCEYDGSESHMYKGIRGIFQKAFTNFTVSSVQGAGFGTDISFLDHSGESVLNIEFKTYLEAISSDPDLQNIEYFMRTKKTAMFLITFIGCQFLQVSGAVSFKTHTGGTKTVVVPLSDPLCLKYMPWHSNHLGGIPKIAKLLHALSVGLGAFTLHPTQSSEHCTLFSLLPHLELDGSSFTYKDRIGSCQQFVFLGNIQDNLYVVKFVPQKIHTYGGDVHKALADAGLAPVLYGVQDINPFWSAIIMEYIEGENLKSVLSYGTISVSRAKDIASHLTTIIGTLHRSNFVHGDLRPENMLITSSNEIRVLDFDWAGNCGKAVYPEWVNAQIQWPKGVKPGSFITADHDSKMVSAITDQLGLS